jgi:hypothetical protein
MEYLDGLSGLQKEPDVNSRVTYKIIAPGAEGLAERVITELPLDRELLFYDKSYPSPSDPGAYIMVRRYADAYFCQRANHGWSTGWTTMSRRRLIRYLGGCLPESGELQLTPFTEIHRKPPRLIRLRARLRSIFSMNR